LPIAVVGDFNMHHREWEADAPRNDARGDDLLAWAAEHLLDIQNDPTVPTRRGQANQRDTVIDL
ncbi:hypothetical protein BV25DRAFT_1771045, partial [Artomyces pyxidatus]